MNLKKRIERLEARRPVDDPVRDSLIWRAMATLPMPDEERAALAVHADAVAAGVARGAPAMLLGFVAAAR